MSAFGKAAAARKKGKDYFTWNGVKYSTALREETKTPITVGYDKRKIQRMLGIIPNQIQGFDTNAAAQYMKDQQEVDRMLLQEGRYVDKDGMSTTNMPEIVVNAARTKIDPKHKGTLFGLLSFQSGNKNLDGRTWQDYNTGQIYVTDNQGNIIGSTISAEAAKKGEFSHYYGMLQKDADRQAHIQAALDLVNRASANIGNPTLTTRQLQEDIRNARSTFANAVNGVVNTPNHLIAGGLKLAVSPSYTWLDYKNGIVNPDINNQIIGAGDLLEVLNPYANFLLNMANPTSMFISAGNSSLGGLKGFKAKALEPGKMQIKAANDPQTRFQTGRGKGLSHNRPVKLSKGGWRSDNKGTSVFHHNAGSGSHLETVELSRGTVVPVVLPGVLSVTPTMYYRSDVENTTSPTVMYTSDLGHVEIPVISPWQRNWINTGEIPASNATRWNSTPREGVYNTENTHWLGLGENGRRYDSALSNTYNNGQGFTVGYKNGGQIPKMWLGGLLRSIIFNQALRNAGNFPFLAYDYFFKPKTSIKPKAITTGENRGNSKTSELEQIIEDENGNTTKNNLPSKFTFDWDTHYKNYLNSLSDKDKQILSNLNIDTSSAENLQKGINTYFGNNVLVSDNMFGRLSKMLLNNLLRTQAIRNLNSDLEGPKTLSYTLPNFNNVTMNLIPPQLKRGGHISFMLQGTNKGGINSWKFSERPVGNLGNGYSIVNHWIYQNMVNGLNLGDLPPTVAGRTIYTSPYRSDTIYWRNLDSDQDFLGEKVPTGSANLRSAKLNFYNWVKKAKPVEGSESSYKRARQRK